MPKKISDVPIVPVRQCSNIKSKKHPDVQCPFTASDGDFCSRHSKNPLRFQEKSSLKNNYSNKQKQSAQKIQSMWKKRVGFLRRKRQGPSVNCPEISNNNTDICTLEDVSSIPLLYRWGYIDSKRHIWSFDIRSLSMLYSQDTSSILLNPYTRENLNLVDQENFQKRCAQLRSHKYCLVHTNTIDLTENQLWHQTLLDTCMKYDMLGYHISLDWFNKLSTVDCYTFYCELWELWSYRLQLSTSMKNKVVVHWNNEETLLFKWIPAEIKHRRNLKWWQKNLLDILNRFVSAPLKEHRTLGALYTMTAFAITSSSVREAYPWLVGED